MNKPKLPVQLFKHRTAKSHSFIIVQLILHLYAKHAIRTFNSGLDALWRDNKYCLFLSRTTSSPQRLEICYKLWNIGFIVIIFVINIFYLLQKNDDIPFAMPKLKALRGRRGSRQWFLRYAFLEKLLYWPSLGKHKRFTVRMIFGWMSFCFFIIYRC